MTTYEARKSFSIHENAYVLGDAVPLADLERVPGDWKKLLRGGFIVEVNRAS